MDAQLSPCGDTLRLAAAIRLTAGYAAAFLSVGCMGCEKYRLRMGIVLGRAWSFENKCTTEPKFKMYLLVILRIRR